MKLKLYRDKVVTMTSKGDLVGLYVKVKPKDKAIYHENKILGEKYGYEIDTSFKVGKTELKEICVMLA